MKYMATRFVPIDWDPPLLLPANLRDWGPADQEILQQPIERVQAQKLLIARKTDLPDKFISKAGK